jgi:hypothetical protein
MSPAIASNAKAGPEGPAGKRPAITLERAVTVIEHAEMALADPETARRKGYLATATSMIFAFMDDYRASRRAPATTTTNEKVQP